MAIFTVILENPSKAVMGGRHRFWDPPTFYKTDVIEADDLDKAWDIARAKWYTQRTGYEIADIKKGEIEPPQALTAQEILNGKGTDKGTREEGSSAESEPDPGPKPKSKSKGT